MAALSQSRLKELLKYNPSTGVFIWRDTGAPAGYINQGYLKLKLDGKKYKGSRLAWFYMTGKWPVRDIDHRNTDKSDDRWDNLREASEAQNSANRGKTRFNTSGFKGVHRYRDKWRAQITFNYKRIHLGLFNTPEDASAAYRAAAVKLFGNFSRT